MSFMKAVADVLCDVFGKDGVKAFLNLVSVKSGIDKKKVYAARKRVKGDSCLKIDVEDQDLSKEEVKRIILGALEAAYDLLGETINALMRLIAKEYVKLHDGDMSALERVLLGAKFEVKRSGKYLEVYVHCPQKEILLAMRRLSGVPLLAWIVAYIGSEGKDLHVIEYDCEKCYAKFEIIG